MSLSFVSSTQWTVDSVLRVSTDAVQTFDPIVILGTNGTITSIDTDTDAASSSTTTTITETRIFFFYY
jgi:L-asparaginase/Glu-tRNA(Gln) amidotransferase subunit D